MTFTYEKVVSIQIVFKINLWPSTVGKNVALGNSLFGAVYLIRNTDFDTYINTG